MSVRDIQFQLPDEEPPSKKMAGMRPFHPDLPQIPFFVGIIGPRHSGKSVFLYNLLSNLPGMYGNSFKKNNIIVYSLTKEEDPTLKQLKLKYMYGPETPPGMLIEHIRKQQMGYKESDNMTGVLLVFDDATQLKNAWPAIESLSYSGRHIHVQVMYVAHKMSSIPRGVRTQTQQWVIFKPHEESELQWLLDMFAKKATKTIWQNALTRAWNSRPHNFVYIDYECKELERIYRSYFHDPLFNPEELALVTGEVPLNSREMGMIDQSRGVGEDSIRKESGRKRKQKDDSEPNKKSRKKE